MTRKIYFAMLNFDIGCFEWDKIFSTREKAENYMKERNKTAQYHEKITEIFEADLE